MVVRIHLIFLFSFLPVLKFAQIDELENLKNIPAFERTIDKDSTVEFYNKHQNYRYRKTIKHFNEFENTTDADLIIELDTVNFAAYENLYRRWGGIPAVNLFYGKYKPIDANKNGKNEIYCWYLVNDYGYNNYTSAQIYENEQDTVFSLIYDYPEDSLNTVFDIGDITGDGLTDLIYRGYVNKMHFFKQETVNSYVTTPNFIYNPFPHVYQPNNVTFYDIDNDNNLEIIYFLFAGDGDSSWAYSNHVAKYNPEINNYELIYYHRPLPDFYTNGISIGDFDQDGKGNFATGSIYGKFYIYEYVEGTDYQVEFTKELETSNAYLTTFTDDMDNNGKPEIWIGGDFASSLYGGVTRLYAFEATSPGNYEQVYQIDIRGIFSVIEGSMSYVDLDGDGLKDLFLTNANLSYGFEYDGNGNYYMDFVVKAPRLDSSYTSRRLERIDLADLDGNGVMEIIPQYFRSKGNPETWEYISLFLKRNNIVDVEETSITTPTEFKLYQNYPNPFNPTTKIKYSIPNVISTEGRNLKVSIKVYDILGKEVTTLVNEQKPPGEYEVEFNGTDLPSGIYFIRMNAGSYQKTIKSVLIK